jgi:circadian clock protein KaiB
MATKKASKAAKSKASPGKATKAGPKKKAQSSAKATAKPSPKASTASKKTSASSAKATGTPRAQWNLRLYVAGDSPRSRTALANLRRLCEQQLKDSYDIEVIDLTQRPDLAKADQILAVPTLIRKIPEPMKRVIGDLSQADRALIALDMEQR